MLSVSSYAFASYKPVPAPEPMETYTVYAGEVFKGEFYIEDVSGPEGFEISCEPNGLIIEEPNITYLTGGDSEILAKEYTYPFSFKPTKTGEFKYTITAIDPLGVTVKSQIWFYVEGNMPHVFTGCKRILKTVKDIPKDIIGTMWTEGEQLTTWPVYNDKNYIYYMQSRIENGRAKTNKYKVAKPNTTSQLG